jgi:dihydropteroate synthase
MIGSRIRLMGILNVTPDSFSDGGKFLSPKAAAERAKQMVAEGADIIDMGAESSRPGSKGVSDSEQLERLLPVLRIIRKTLSTPISIDTQSAAVAAACLGEGANMINDISAGRHDVGMLSILSGSRCEIVLMHMKGTPRTMQKQPRYKEVVREIISFFEKRIVAFAEAGIPSERLLIDPGIGFGKTLAHNLEILQRLQEFSALHCPVVFGASRKSFLGQLTNEPAAEKRVVASVAAGILAAERGADILRVHDVAEHHAALQIVEAVRKLPAS